MQKQPIKKRHVFFISGFDPRGARYYYQHYKEEWAKKGFNPSAISPRTKASDKSSHFTITQNTTKTTFEILQYDDIIRAHWFKSPLDSLYNFFLYCKNYIFSLEILKIKKASYPTFITGLMPFILFLLFCINSFASLFFIFKQPLGLIITAFIYLFLAHFFNKTQSLWLLRIYCFTRLFADNQTENQEERISFFANRINQILLDDDCDEVLLIAHSVGCILAIPVLERLSPNPKLKVMTLGHCIPVVSLYKSAKWYDDIVVNLTTKPITWLDYSSPIDGAAFPLVHPLYPHHAKADFVKVKSPRFHLHYSKEKYNVIKKDWFARHFLYFKTPDIAGDYDFIGMTSSEKPLELWGVK